LGLRPLQDPAFQRGEAALESCPLGETQKVPCRNHEHRELQKLAKTRSSLTRLDLVILQKRGALRATEPALRKGLMPCRLLHHARRRRGQLFDCPASRLAVDAVTDAAPDRRAARFHVDAADIGSAPSCATSRSCVSQSRFAAFDIRSLDMKAHRHCRPCEK